MGADAQGRNGHGRGAQEMRGAPPSGAGFGRGWTMSMEQAVSMIACRTPGRLLDAALLGPNYPIDRYTDDLLTHLRGAAGEKRNNACERLESAARLVALSQDDKPRRSFAVDWPPLEAMGCYQPPFRALAYER